MQSCLNFGDCTHFTLVHLLTKIYSYFHMLGVTKQQLIMQWEPPSRIESEYSLLFDTFMSEGKKICEEKQKKRGFIKPLF